MCRKWLTVDKATAGDLIASKETIYNHESTSTERIYSQHLTIDSWDELISEIVRGLGGSIEVQESRIEETSLGHGGSRGNRNSGESEDERREVHCDGKTSI
jgi:hypothetical protein